MDYLYHDDDVTEQSVVAAVAGASDEGLTIDGDDDLLNDDENLDDLLMLNTLIPSSFLPRSIVAEHLLIAVAAVDCLIVVVGLIANGSVIVTMMIESIVMVSIASGQHGADGHRHHELEQMVNCLMIVMVTFGDSDLNDCVDCKNTDNCHCPNDDGSIHCDYDDLLALDVHPLVYRLSVGHHCGHQFADCVAADPITVVVTHPFHQIRSDYRGQVAVAYDGHWTGSGHG